MRFCGMSPTACSPRSSNTPTAPGAVPGYAARCWTRDGGVAT